jgi:hypothetical protein
MNVRVSLAVLFISSLTFANALKPKGDPAAALTLVENGKSRYAIVVPVNETPQETKASQELQHWFQELTGDFMLCVVGDANGRTIRIATDKTLPDEGYRIAVDGEHLLLTGGPGRGVLNAVYALLEEDIGCRWYTNDSIVLPKSPTLKVSPVARTYAPKLMLRDPFYFASFDGTWSLRNRTNAPDANVPEEAGGHVDYGGLFVHTHASLLPADNYFKDHPEYFAQDAAGKRYPNQLCPTNPDTIRIVTENVLAILKKHPETEIVSVSKNDSAGDQICHCERCRKLRTEEGGTDAANQLFLVNQVAEAVEKQYPNVLVDTLAYLETIRPPKTIRPRKNVVVRVCNDTVGAWGRPFTPARQLPVADIVKQWAAIHVKLSVWDYNVNFSHFLAPMPNMDVIADNIRFWVDNHAIGLLTQGGYQSTSERDEMRSWVIAKLMWDPSRDVDALVNDFIEGHYGNAAPMLKEYEALLASSRTAHESVAQNPPGGIRYPMDVAFLDKDFLAKATDVFARAKQAAKDDKTVLRRVERAELPILYVKLAQGPVTRGVLDPFERVARREKVDWLFEWSTRLDQQLDTWEKQIAATTQPTKISRGEAAATYQAFPDACRLKNGDIVAVFYAGYGHVAIPATDDFPKGGRLCMVRSSDEGRTWTKPEIIYDDDDDNRDPHIAQLDDGTIVVTFFSWRYKPGAERLKSSADYSQKFFRANCVISGAQMITSRDGGKTWDKKARDIFPDYAVSAPVRQLPDGTCILGLYGRDKTAGSKVEVGASARSTDRGATWETPVQMTAPPGVSLDAETDVIRLKDGRLYAALRDSKLNMRYAISTDEGRSWGPAEDMGFPGHCPHLNRLSTGEILMATRVPQTELRISRDECKTWSGPYRIDDVIGAYPATVELKDKTVLIVYYTEGFGSHIRARRFKLTDGGIEFVPVGAN